MTMLASFTRWQSDLAVAIIAASGTGLVAISSVVTFKYWERRTALIQQLRWRKLPIYEDLIASLFTVQFAQQRGEQPLSKAELRQVLTASTEKLAIWGSDEVILMFHAFSMAVLKGAQPTELGLLSAHVVLAIRRDLGYKNRHFKSGTLLGLFASVREE